jgi:C1A family cysteine protease
MIGIDCGRNFNPNARGILPPQSGSGGGHGLAVVGKTKKLDGIWRLIIPNSWGINWGDAGYCYMDRTFIDSAGGGHYELSASEDDPIDHNNPSKAA